VFIGPGDDPHVVATLLNDLPYDEDFCVATDFSPGFIARLMAAGFLVMSMVVEETPGGPELILLPKLHRERSVLLFDGCPRSRSQGLHESRTVRRLAPRYELRVFEAAPNTPPGDDFDRILERCAQVHGEDWLTPPLRESFSNRRHREHRSAPPFPAPFLPFLAFGLYRQGKPVAGEFGVVTGRVYTSYSGYYDEDSAGSVQLVLTGRYLRDAGFAFWDLGMPMPYKDRLGAQTVDRSRFLELFRKSSRCARIE
jgi:Leu/Phe-tRNA-protein transferase